MILADMMHIPINVLIVESFILSIGVMTSTVILLYEILIRKWQDMSHVKKAMVLLIAYIIIYSYLSIEFIIFLETCVMALGLLLSVQACKVVIDNEKYKFAKSFLLLFIAVFCYQGAIAIFPMILLSYYAIIEPLKFKEYVKLGIKVALIYGIEMFLTILYVKIFIPTGSRIQIGVEGILTIESIEKWLKYIVVDSLNVIYPFLNVGMIVFTVFFGLLTQESMKGKLYKIFLYLVVVLASIIICLMPILVSSGLELYPRMCTAYGYTVGISLLFLLEKVRSENDKKLKNIFVYSSICCIFLFNTALYIVLTHQHLMVNREEEKLGEKINQTISEYERKTETEISNFYCVISRSGIKPYLDDCFICVPNYTQRVVSSWAVPYFFIFYTHDMNFYGSVPMECLLDDFPEVNKKQLEEDNIYIVEDTAYFYVD